MLKVSAFATLKVTAVALGVAGVVGLTISGAAAFGVGTGSLGAGTTVVAACQPAGTPIAVSFSTTDNPTKPGYTLSRITLAGIDAACNGKPISVTLAGTSNAELVEFTGTAATGSVRLTVPHAVPANAVASTTVVVGE